ncbi:hypothetical protein BOTNAR_0738g00020 [Botryotinia narcissicola]|uniref:Uncharacterized protein n=1 Tax=Botryotinia narcissicola TaxID=278944 RepID=A0A4Z1H6M2_9HELO|nr:hypothetical protein BOTNAR_0738g00020 [Botryotinia narcissicola]
MSLNFLATDKKVYGSENQFCVQLDFFLRYLSLYIFAMDNEQASSSLAGEDVDSKKTARDARMMFPDPPQIRKYLQTKPRIVDLRPA